MALSDRFEIDDTLWAERDDGVVRFYRKVPGSVPDQVVLEVGLSTLRNVITWADEERGVTAFFTGPMASQVRESAKVLGLTPEMFVWYAVKAFMEVGSHSH